MLSRRDFIHAGCAAGAVTLAPNFLDVAEAGLHMHGTSGFNGGKSQINLNFPGGGGDFPFINLLKTGVHWTLGDSTGVPTPDQLDANGYLNDPLAVTNHSGVFTNFDIPSQSQKSGNYKITWDGGGTISFSGTVVSGGTFGAASASTSGVIISPTQIYNFQIGVTAINSALDYPHNIQVFNVNDETLLNAGQVFGIKFKQRLQEGNIGVIRFLNWIDTNVTNLTTWSSNKSVNYFSFATDEYRSNIYVPTGATLSGAAYTASAPAVDSVTGAAWNNTLHHGTTVQLKFNTAISSACTLQVGSTAAKSILRQYGDALTSLFPVTNRLATLVYDINLDAWIKFGGDGTFLDQGLINGIPPAIMIRLCAEIGAYPYISVPPISHYPITDYSPQFAALIKATGPSWMVPIFEGPNETFNFVVNVTPYAQAVGTYMNTTLGWAIVSSAYHLWYGVGMSLLGQAINSVYGGSPHTQTAYKVVCGVQTNYGLNSSQYTSHNDRMTAAGWIASGASAPSGYTKAAPSTVITHIAPAQYFTPSEYATSQELIDAYNFVVTNAGNPTAQHALIAAYADTVLTGSGAFTLPMLQTYALNWKTWALSFSVNKMLGYEGGYSPNYTPGDDVISYITGATKANPCVLTLSNTSTLFQSYYDLTKSAAVVGMKLKLASVPGMTQLNGVTGTGSPAGQVTITAVSGNQVTIDVDSSAFSTFGNPVTATMATGTPGVITVPSTVGLGGTPISFHYTGTILTGAPPDGSLTFANTPINGTQFTVQEFNVTRNFSGTQSGTITMVSAAGTAQYVNSSLNLNNFRQASSQLTSTPSSPTGQAGYLATVFNQFVGVSDGSFTAEFPSQYYFSGSISHPGNIFLDGLTGTGTALSSWTALQDIYQSPNPPIWNAIIAFNH